MAFALDRGVLSPTHIQLPSTLIIDLTLDEDRMMSDMAKKTRQYLRKSLRNGVTIRKVEDPSELDTCLDIYDQTARRADFSLHDRDYYRAVFTELRPYSHVYMAEIEDRPVAFLWVVASADTVVELYGGANHEGLRSQANYGLKWLVMLDQKERGAKNYDLNGLLGEGITHFKKGFSSHVNELHAGVDVPLNALYPLWSRALPVARATMAAAKQQLRRLRDRSK